MGLTILGRGEAATAPTSPGPGFTLTEAQRRAMSNKLMLQAPRDLTPKQILNVARDLDSRIKSLPPGAFMALDAMRLLGDGGNELAKDMFEMMSYDLGLTRPFASRRK